MSNKGQKAKELTTRGLVMASIEDMPELGTEWLWPGRIAMDSVTLLVGDADVGKSLVALDIAARVSRGAEWPDGKPSAGAGRVMLFSAEDHLIRRVRPALRAAGADLSKFSFPYLTAEANESTQARRPINFKRDLELLANALETTPECKLVIIDPFIAFMGSGAGTDHPDVTSVLRTLYGLAAQYHVAIMVVTHLRNGNGPVMQRAVGGLGLTTMARAIWMVGAAPESSTERVESGQGKVESGGERRWLLPVKNNLAGERTGLGFRLRMGVGEIVPQVEWSEGEVEMTADEALRELRRHGKSGSPKGRGAVEFLREALAEGPRPVKEVEAEARKLQGIGHDALKRARKEIETVAFRPESLGPWWMRLPESNEDDIGAQQPCSCSTSNTSSEKDREFRTISEVQEHL